MSILDLISDHFDKVTKRNKIITFGLVKNVQTNSKFVSVRLSGFYDFAVYNNYLVFESKQFPL